jgi:hypothetical protein
MILQRVLIILAGVLVVKVTVAVILGYVNYFPPNFQAEFLHGRDDYFFGGYQWAFYPHIVSGPVSLMLGLILVSDRFRLKFPQWHRCLGRIQVACVLFVVAPTGLWMAYYAVAGPIGAIGFAVLAVLTGTCAALGWRKAVQRRFLEHRRWMWRCFLLLCSAVVLRLIGGLATVIGAYTEHRISIVWFDPLASWASWLVPLAIFEISLRLKRPIRLRP